MGNQLMALGLTEHGRKVVVSSRDIARVFEKEHKNTLADIRRIIAVDDEFNRLNLQPVEYYDLCEKEMPAWYA